MNGLEVILISLSLSMQPDASIIRCDPNCPVAPHSGVLLSDEAYASLVAGIDADHRLHDAELKLKLGLDATKVEGLQAQLRASEKNEERLVKLVQDASRPAWVDAIIFASGAVSVILGAWAISMVGK
jgi:aryl carrier-like protein